MPTGSVSSLSGFSHTSTSPKRARWVAGLTGGFPTLFAGSFPNAAGAITKSGRRGPAVAAAEPAGLASSRRRLAGIFVTISGRESRVLSACAKWRPLWIKVREEFGLQSFFCRLCGICRLPRYDGSAGSGRWGLGPGATPCNRRRTPALAAAGAHGAGQGRRCAPLANKGQLPNGEPHHRYRTSVATDTGVREEGWPLSTTSRGTRAVPVLLPALRPTRESEGSDTYITLLPC